MQIKSYAVIAAAVFYSAFHAAAIPVDPTVRKASTAEIYETVIPEGVLLRANDGTPGAVYVGDGITPGGTQIGDGMGWQEGESLTRDLYTGGHKIILGNWSLLTLGGWAALSGGEASVTTGGVFHLSQSGSVFMEAISENALVQISSFGYQAPYLVLGMSAAGTQATIEYSTNLISSTWTTCPVESIATNGSVRQYNINPTNFSTYAYFRATISSGSGSEVNFLAAVKENGVRLVTIVNVQSGAALSATNNNGAVTLTIPTNPPPDMSGYLTTTGTVNAANLTNTLPSGVLGTSVSRTVGGLATTGTVQAASFAGSGANLTGITASQIGAVSTNSGRRVSFGSQALYLSSVNYTASPLGSEYYGFTHNAQSDTHYLPAPAGSTNIFVGLIFGYTDQTNQGCRIRLQYRTITSTNTIRTSDLYYNWAVSATNGWNGTATNSVVYISAGIPTNHWGERGGQLSVWTYTPSGGGLTTYQTNGLWFLIHEADIQPGY